MSAACMRRTQVDIRRFNESPPPGIFIDIDDTNVRHIHALIIGPKDTPYEDGFFYFDFQIPDGYPHSPPKVKLMTTANGAVRFNPNLYNCGKVCLSILGTWSGPSWNPLLSISTVLISIQSLMCEEPYYNEPGREGLKEEDTSKSYNIKTQYHTLKHAVGDMLDKTTKMPEKLYDVAQEYFLNNFDNYIELCNKNEIYDNTSQNDGFNGQVMVNFSEQKHRLMAMKDLLNK